MAKKSVKNLIYVVDDEKNVRDILGNFEKKFDRFIFAVYNSGSMQFAIQ